MRLFERHSIAEVIRGVAVAETPQSSDSEAPDAGPAQECEGTPGVEIGPSPSGSKGLSDWPATSLEGKNVVERESTSTGADHAPTRNKLPLSPGFILEGSDAPIFGRMPLSNSFMIGNRSTSVIARLDKPEIVIFSNVLTETECSELIALSCDKLSRSATVDPVSGRSTIGGYRTSVGTLLRRGDSGLVDSIDDRISRLLCWPATHFEDMQVVKYTVGEEFKPHFDFFRPERPGSSERLADGGQRVGTIIVYLNEVEDGGETVFPQIGLSVIPRMGSAVYFANVDSDNTLNPMSLHGGAPVRRGEKWIATKWLREYRRYGASCAHNPREKVI